MRGRAVDKGRDPSLRSRALPCGVQAYASVGCDFAPRLTAFVDRAPLLPRFGGRALSASPKIAAGRSP